MDYKNELETLLKYCKDSANYITDEDCTEDKYARMAYRDVIGEIEKIFEREKESSDDIAALHLHDVSVSLPTPVEIWNKAKKLNGVDFTTWYRNNVGYER